MTMTERRRARPGILETSCSVSVASRALIFLVSAALAAVSIVFAPTSSASVGNPVVSDYDSRDLLLLDLCSSERPIRWTVAASPRAKAKNVRKIRKEAKKQLDRVSKISQGRFTYQFVPDAKVVSREVDPFKRPQTPNAVSENRDIDIVIAVTAPGKPSFDDPFTSPQRSNLGYYWFSWNRDKSRPEKYKSTPPPSPVVIGGRVPHMVAANTSLLHRYMRTLAILSVFVGSDAPSTFNKSTRKKIRMNTKQWCDAAAARAQAQGPSELQSDPALDSNTSG